MASFKKVQEIEDIIDDEESVLLYEPYKPSNLPFPHTAQNEKFSLANKDPAEYKADFRVVKTGIPLLLDALRVPPVFLCRSGTITELKKSITELKEGIKTHKVSVIKSN